MVLISIRYSPDNVKTSKNYLWGSKTYEFFVKVQKIRNSDYAWIRDRRMPNHMNYSTNIGALLQDLQ